jgi:hypothetical protein
MTAAGHLRTVEVSARSGHSNVTSIYANSLGAICGTPYVAAISVEIGAFECGEHAHGKA